MKQRTIAKPFNLQGIGLHSGKPVDIQFLPANENFGIQFLRSDLANPTPIIARYDQIHNTVMSSNLTNEAGQQIGTVEHLLSAIACLGIDNLMIQVSAPEIPILDGSAIQFIQHFLKNGIQSQNEDKKFIKILTPIQVNQGEKWAKFEPFDGFSLDFEIDFNHPSISANNNHFQCHFSSQNFIQQIANARTFGFLKDIEYLKNNNLALGGSMDNAIVLDDQHILNPEGLRFNDELVRHKILDAVGDLYLAGHQILGAFSGYKSGHSLNNQLLKAVFSDTNHYEIVTKCFKDEMIIYDL